ncbi:MAG: NADP-specific glutamate dehydrogenase [Candidatus Heimdallarchaeota archaeon]|nr:MAG: NADP-specific glutamate dehydrogenase [Candidatus Gerdarchaeota archaeon]RLI72745.1 MAG: NADP-specific glutamate dehydrogenase [Candidatus Heimdallarchaeota archaeon]
MGKITDPIYEQVVKRNAHEPEFHQAVKEVLDSIEPALEQHPEFVKAKIVERLVEPERVIHFRVAWVDDKGEVQVNRGFRIQFNGAIGPYKGGLRFHPTVYSGILKFLAFEQIFKNALTGLPMGGAKGGSDFDPHGKSDGEIMRFCQAFMNELYRHIDADLDVPAGDIGVGGREIGYLFGQYRKIKNIWHGVLTGKGYEYGGSLGRPEATGFGAVWFAEEMLKARGDTTGFKGKTVAISGAGNVAQHASQLAMEMGAKVVTLSDSTGFIYDKKGLDKEKWKFVMHLKNVKRGRIKEYAEKFKGVEYYTYNEDKTLKSPWYVPEIDIAIPSATQNEVDFDEAKALVKNGCIVVSEGANMPCVPKAVDYFIEKGVSFGPGKAANAGGVATSGLEMTQNSERRQWSFEKVIDELHKIMINIHNTAYKTAEKYGYPGNYVVGANIAGFLKVAKAMLAQGVL